MINTEIAKGLRNTVRILETEIAHRRNELPDVRDRGYVPQLAAIGDLNQAIAGVILAAAWYEYDTEVKKAGSWRKWPWFKKETA